jgi:hypothetical protein
MRLRALATSREPLWIDGEVTYRLAPLAVVAADASIEEVTASTAVQLFRERAGANARGAFDSERSCRLFAEICRRVDGLPLAIELAAARVAGLAPQDITAHLDDLFTLLPQAARRADGAQRSLRATVEWSDALLFVKGVYSAFGSGDIAKVLGSMHPQIQWTQTAGYKIGGVHQSPQAILDNVFAKCARGGGARPRDRGLQDRPLRSIPRQRHEQPDPRPRPKARPGQWLRPTRSGSRAEGRPIDSRQITARVTDPSMRRGQSAKIATPTWRAAQPKSADWGRPAFCKRRSL